MIYKEFSKLTELIEEDEKRSLSTLHLTANECAMSDIAKKYYLYDIAERYYFGGGDFEGVVDFGPSTFRGQQGVQELVDNASDIMRRRLGAAEVSFSPLSGVHAMMCALLAVTKPGDTVMSLAIDHGGHFSTQNIIQATGRRWVESIYDYEKNELDISAIKSVVDNENVTTIYLDTSFCVKPHNLRALRRAIGEKINIIYDASHTLGLIMSGQFQKPLYEGADIICANTHKTFPGPQKGLIASHERLGTTVIDAVNNGLFSSPHTASVIAACITVLEMDNFGEGLATITVQNANILAGHLDSMGYKLRRADEELFTHNHQLHILTDHMGNYRDLYRVFSKNNISVNFSNVFGGRMFIRLGLQEVSRRGMIQGDMAYIADILDRTLRGEDTLSEDVAAFVEKYKEVGYTF